jgi:hypothetical protein
MKFTRVVLVAVISTCSLVAVSQPVHAVAEPTFFVDPNLTAADQTYATEIRTEITKAAAEFGHTGFTVVIYGPTLAGANWAVSEGSKVSCLASSPETLMNITAMVGGRCMWFKAGAVSYPDIAKTIESVAYHEVFHLVQLRLQTGSRLRYRDMVWMIEGTADLVGYQPQITAGKRTQDELIALLRVPASLTRSSLIEVSNAASDPSIPVVSDPKYRVNAMYGRSYLAAYYLASISSADKVLYDYLLETSRVGDYVAAFTNVFGMTVSEYDAKFTAWLDAWTPQTPAVALAISTTPRTPVTLRTPATPTTSVAPNVAYILTTKKAATLKSVAIYGMMTVPSGARVTGVVASSSKKVCRVVGKKVKGIKKGRCRVTITVKAKSGTKTTRMVALPVGA